jgi:predicted protein tyrosine phosphatase
MAEAVIKAEAITWAEIKAVLARLRMKAVPRMDASWPRLKQFLCLAQLRLS